MPESTEAEAYYDDEERDPNAPNPDKIGDMELPAEFEFDPAIQNAAWFCDNSVLLVYMLRDFNNKNIKNGWSWLQWLHLL